MEDEDELTAAQSDESYEQLAQGKPDWELIKRFANMPPAKKFALVFKWHHERVESLKKEFREQHPDLSEREIMLLVIERLHGIQIPRYVGAK